MFNPLYIFGNNVVIGTHIKNQLTYIADKIPADFFNKKLDDLGCGDGKITVLLADLFKAQNPVRGFEIDANLVKRANDKGIVASVCDLEKNVPTGEMAVIWGGLHHLKDPEATLKKIASNYQFLFFREPLRKKVDILELGKPFQESELDLICSEVLGDYTKFVFNNAYFVFWKR